MAESVGNTSHETENNDDDKELLVVFMCSTCSKIICDSSSWIGCNEEDKTIVVDRVTENVNIKEEVCVVKSGDKAGCSYHVLECAKCDCVVGRMYITTPSNLDSIRDVFYIDVFSLDEYQIGSGTKVATKYFEKGNNVRSLSQLCLQIDKMQEQHTASVNRFTLQIEKMQQEIKALQETVSQNHRIVSAIDKNKVAAVATTHVNVEAEMDSQSKDETSDLSDYEYRTEHRDTQKADRENNFHKTVCNKDGKDKWRISVDNGKRSSKSSKDVKPDIVAIQTSSSDSHATKSPIPKRKKKKLN